MRCLLELLLELFVEAEIGQAEEFEGRRGEVLLVLSDLLLVGFDYFFEGLLVHVEHDVIQVEEDVRLHLFHLLDGLVDPLFEVVDLADLVELGLLQLAGGFQFLGLEDFYE